MKWRLGRHLKDNQQMKVKNNDHTTPSCKRMSKKIKVVSGGGDGGSGGGGVGVGGASVLM